MLDWITLVIEAVGIVILLMWIVIPIQEFRQILKIVKAKPPSPPEAADEPQRGFGVISDEPPPREDGRRP